MLNAGRVGVTPNPPSRPTLVYDDSCGFCKKWVRRVQRWDRAKAVAYVPLQDSEAPTIAGRPREALHLAAHLVRPDGAVYAGAAAARELFRYLPGGVVPRLLMRVPGVMPIAERVYRWIARRWGPVD
jgi:predicted DCC family thiol-disulfide oxidoreductase YuxK